MQNSVESLGPGGSHDDEGNSLARDAYRQLERLIVTLEVRPGTALSEVALSRRLGIGRTPIREAIKRLEREGLIMILPRRGIMVTDINLEHYLKVLEARGQLELLVGRAAAERATSVQRQRMREIAKSIEEAGARGDGEWFMNEGWDFQGLPVQAAHNECIADAMRLFHGRSRRFWYAFYEHHASIEEAAAVHAQRLRAIADGDPDAAEQASRRMMEYLDAFARSTLQFKSAMKVG